MKKVLFRLSAILILTAMIAGMILPMSAFAAGTSEEITNSLGAYPYPYPLQGDRLAYCSWNERDNTPNSVWYNDSASSYYNTKAKTNGYTDSNGVHHPYGVGMHSSIKFAPSAVYSIDAFKMTSFKTTVFLVQYDMADEAGMIDITPTGEDLVPIVVYLDLGIMVGNEIVWSQSDDYSGEVTYFMEDALLSKGDSVVLEADASDLAGYTHIRIGIKTRHGIYRDGFEGDYTNHWHDSYLIGNTAMASVYFADLEITQSEEVPVITAPSIPTRPTTAAAQTNAYEVILPPEVDDDNWYGKPYGAWKAGNNDTYYLSDMTYLESSNTPNDKTHPQGQPTTVNYPYSSSAGTPFLFGAEGMEHELWNGIGMHPKNPTQPVIGRTDSWTIYDISAYTAEGSATPADTFYALVGLTAASNAWGSRLSSKGVYVYIYGDKTGDGQHYELLAASELVKGYNLGEFNVNVEGVKLLLIDVILPPTATSHGYSAVGLGNACLFTADDEAIKPNYKQDKPHDFWNGTWKPYSDTQHKMTCDCGEKTIYNTHTWNNGVITTNPICMQAGIMTYTCTGCGYQKTETFNGSQHSYSAWATSCSDTQHKRTCDCGEKTMYSDHNWDYGVITTASKCMQPGIKTYTCTGCGHQKTEPYTGSKHNYSSLGEPHSETQHKMTCDCGEKTSYADHIWNSGVTTKASTHKQTGIRTYTCYDCGATKTETIAKIPHKWSSVWLSEDETRHKHLCDCGEIEYADHTYDDEKDAICNDCGYQRVISDTQPSTSTPGVDSSDSQTRKTHNITFEKIKETYLPGCASTVTIGTGFATVLMSLSAAWLAMKKKKSPDED